MAKMINSRIWTTCPVCGQQHRVDRTFYSQDDATAWETELEANPETCPTCKDNARREAHKAAAEAQAAKDADNGLAPLQGSEKQTIWATQIRGQMLEAYTAMRAAVKGDLNEAGKAQLAALEANWVKVLANTSASWWIDHRNDFRTKNDLAMLIINYKG